MTSESLAWSISSLYLNLYYHEQQIMFVLQYSYTSRLWLVNLWKVHSENIFSNKSEPAATGPKTKQTILGVYYTIIPWKRVQSEKQNSIILEHNPNHFSILSSLIGVQHRQSRSKGLFSILLCNEVVQFSLNWLITSLSTWKLPNNVHQLATFKRRTVLA